ncbi:hypothetical protein J2W32_001465 [Variovorax boronicumulans]|uniref:Uncharacterized protein n=1 Tax=Variovorax boronicumulans TaxID=436515 RepID=A0AAW8CSE3_9BURK|nr:hypothetical protein [Variovorax boronicumulans]MDP9893230.1 hypothetical protein [Variovorax boronicumulans]MDQ0052423.1 hypothetical protein [Variovorax boronicumulans]
MKEKLLGWGTLICLAVLTCLLLVHALAIFPGVSAIRWFFVTSALVLGRLDAPAWVQAVGSISAIVGAAWIAGWQASTSRRDAERRERRANTSKLLAIVLIFRRADLVVENAWRALQGNATTWRIAADQVDLVQQALRALPVFEIPSATVVFEVQRADRDLIYISRILQSKIDDVPRAKVIGRGLFTRVQARLRVAVHVCAAEMDKATVKELKLSALQKDDQASTGLDD